MSALGCNFLTVISLNFARFP